MQRRWWPADWQKWAFLTVLVAAFSIGVFARTQAWLSIRSLWADEACLANNILSRSYAGLLQPLDENQGAPVGFLLAVKALVNLFGNHERVLRFLPWLAGMVSLPLFYLAARRSLNRWGIIIGLVLFSLQPNLIRYSAEFKQYSSDAAISLGLLLVGGMFLREKKTWFQVFLLSAAGAAAVWCAFPSLFVLAAIGATWAITTWKESRNLPWMKMAVTAAIWLASFGANYLVSLTGLLQNSYLTRFWSFGYIPFPPTQWTDVRWHLEMPINLLNVAAVNPYWGVAGLFLVVGVIGWIKNAEVEGWLILFTIGFLAAASLARVYPFVHRMVLFAIPLGVLLSAKGIQETLRLLPKWRWGAAVLIVVLTGTFPLAEVLDPSLLVTQHEEVGRAVNFIHDNWVEGDLIYVNQEARCAFQYYTQGKGFLTSDYRYTQRPFSPNPEDWSIQFAGEVKALQGRPRVWFLFAHTYVDGLPRAQVVLKMMGTEMSRQIFEGASVYLYDLRQPTISR